MISYRMEPGPIHIGIEAAWLSYLGAVSSASLRYYDQDERVYVDFEIDAHLEVLSGVGNVSLLDGAPFVHTHAAFADEEGRAWGGHLNTGTRVWALEVRIQELVGEPLVRRPDDCTSLSLWGGTLDDEGS
jgi:predicted DNA-binding protein with PD1-like motif